MIEKNSDEQPDSFIEFKEIYNNEINTPMIWVCENKDDIKPYTVILDGHFTLLIYNAQTDDLSWEAVNEPGSYIYTPDNIGDGVIYFPHTFYFEFQVIIGNKQIDLSTEFYASEVSALAMTMSNVNVKSIIDNLRKRISEIYESELSDLEVDIKNGELLEIPNNIKSKLDIKLAMLGINFDYVRVMNVNEYMTGTMVAEDEYYEEVFDNVVPPQKVKKADKSKIKKPNPPPVAKTSPAAASAAPPAPSAAPPAPSAAPPAPSAAPPAPSAAPPAPSAAPPAPSAAPPAPSAAPPAPSSAPPAPSAAPPAPSAAPPAPSAAPSTPAAESKPRSSRKRSVSAKPKKKKSELRKIDTTTTLKSEFMEEEMAIEDLQTIPSPPKTEVRNIHVSWFERMLPNRAYPLKIILSSKMNEVHASVTSVVSGEKISETTSVMDVDVDQYLLVKPEFPGCLVTPSELKFKLGDESKEIMFYITPLVMGSLNVNLYFLQNEKIIHTISLSTKVIKHRLSKISAMIGSVAGILPGLFAFFLNEPLDQFMEDRFATYMPVLTGTGFLVPGASMLGFFVLSGLIYLFQQPKKRSQTLSFPR